MMKKLLLLSLTVITTSLVVPKDITAQKEKHRFGTPVKNEKVAKHNTWSLLGKKMVDMKMDKDEIMVAAYEGDFTSLKLVVSKSPIYLKSIDVIFANGEMKKFMVDKKYVEGSGSEIFDLPGNKRKIEKIKFIYKSTGEDGDKAVVQVWGNH